MPGKRIAAIKPLVSLILFLACWLLLPPFVKRFGQASFYEFQAPVNVAASKAKDLQTYWDLRSRSRNELIEANRDLARQNAFYQVSLQRQYSLEREIERLEQLLRLPREDGYHLEVARVARRDLTVWWQQLVVRKGQNHNIPVGAAVIYEGGVVGRVREVHAYTSVVELVSSPGFRMAANVEGKDAPVTYQGLANPPLAPPRGEVLNIPPDVRLASGGALRLVSSPLGGIFPQGLTIGEVISLEPGPDGYFQRGTVRLNPDLSSLNEVAIVVPVGMDLPESHQP